MNGINEKKGRLRSKEKGRAQDIFNIKVLHDGFETYVGGSKRDFAREKTRIDRGYEREISEIE